MKKKKIYYLANGKKVHIGDTLSKVAKGTDPVVGDYRSVTTIVVTETLIPHLLKAGIIVDKAPTKKQASLQYYIHQLAKRLGWKPEKMTGFLNTLNLISPSAVFSILLREVAIELDKKYEGLISECPEVYIVSMADGKIGKLAKAQIRSYKNFAAFRTIEDAKFACHLLRPFLKPLYEGKPKD